MTTEPRSPLSETEKRAAFLAELEAERARRVEAGKWVWRHSDDSGGGSGGG